MKKCFFILIFVALAGAGYLWYTGVFDGAGPVPQSESVQQEQTVELYQQQIDDVIIYPIEHASFVMDWNGMVMYVDPVGGGELYQHHPQARLVLLTHTHGDHLDPETLQAVVGPDTLVLAPQSVYDQLPDSVRASAIVMANDERMELTDLTVTAVPMYNLPGDSEGFHPKGLGNGYVLSHGGQQIYIAGDSADTPEMRALQDIDIAFVPMNLPFTMDVPTAADAVLDFAPRSVVPYHYRGRDGLSDVAEFQRLVSVGSDHIEVVLLEWYR